MKKQSKFHVALLTAILVFGLCFGLVPGHVGVADGIMVYTAHAEEGEDDADYDDGEEQEDDDEGSDAASGDVELQIIQVMAKGKNPISGELYEMDKFVAGKSTVIRAQFSGERDIPQDGSLAVTISKDGSELIELLPISGGEADNAVFAPRDIADLGSWEAGEYEFVLSEDGEEIATRSAEFKDAKKIKVLMVPVLANYGGEVVGCEGEWQTGIQMTKDTYPLADDGIEVVLDDELDCSGDEFDLRTDEGQYNVWQLKGAFKHAVRQKYIAENPMAEVKKPKTKKHKENDEYKAFTPEQMQILFEKVTDPMWLALITIMRYSGCRPGEAAGSKPGDFDHEKKIFGIHRAVSMEYDIEPVTKKATNPRPIVKDLKNEDREANRAIKSERNVPINDKVLAAVNALLKDINETKIKNSNGRGNGCTNMEMRRKNRNNERNNGYNPEEFLFATQCTGMMINPDYLCIEYRKYLKSVGLDPKEYNMYRLRHSYCTQALKQTNNNIKAVQVLMGDNDPNMILSVYNAVNRKELVDEVAEKLMSGLESY